MVIFSNLTIIYKRQGNFFNLLLRILLDFVTISALIMFEMTTDQAF